MDFVLFCRIYHISSRDVFRVALLRVRSTVERIKKMTTIFISLTPTASMRLWYFAFILAIIALAVFIMLLVSRR